MGGKESKQVENQNCRVNHPKFENSSFFKDENTEEEYIQITVPVVNEKEYNTWVSKLQSKSAPFDQTETFMLPKNYSFKKQGMCGSSGIAKIDYDNFPFLLIDEINNRASLNHKAFDETELWYLLYTLVASAKDFHRRDIKVGDIRPNNLFINEDGQIKIGTQFSWPGESINYAKTFFEKEVTYLSPQETKEIQFGKSQSQTSPDLSEAFSVGLTCLDAALLDSSQILYSKNNKFDYERLEDKLRALRNAGYSQLLFLVISNLCETAAEDRSTCNQIYEWLIPQQAYINNLEDFQVNSLPEKVDRTRVKRTEQMVKNPNYNNQNMGHAGGNMYPPQNFYPNQQIVRPPIHPNAVVPILVGQPYPGKEGVIVGPPMTKEQILAQRNSAQITFPNQPMPGQSVPSITVPVTVGGHYSQGNYTSNQNTQGNSPNYNKNQQQQGNSPNYYNGPNPSNVQQQQGNSQNFTYNQYQQGNSQNAINNQHQQGNNNQYQKGSNKPTNTTNSGVEQNTRFTYTENSSPSTQEKSNLPTKYSNPQYGNQSIQRKSNQMEPSSKQQGDQYNKTFQKIDQQLQMSRKMFPS